MHTYLEGRPFTAKIVERKSRHGVKYGVMVYLNTYRRRRTGLFIRKEHIEWGDPLEYLAGYDENGFACYCALEPFWSDKRGEALELLKLLEEAGDGGSPIEALDLTSNL